MPRKLDEQDELDILKEVGLDPQQWKIVETAPIQPGQNPPPLLGEDEISLQYPAHHLPTNMLSARAQSAKPQQGIPVRALWPVQAPGKANSNSAIVSGTAKIARQAQQGVAVANTPVVGVDGSGNTTLAPISKLPTPPKIRMPITQDNMPDGSNFGRVVNTALTANQVDPSKSGFLSKGVRPFSIAPQPAFVAGNGTVSFYYDGTNTSLPLHLFRDDGTIVDLHGSTAITGLTTGQTYYFYPAFDEPTGTVVWATDLPVNNFIGAQLGMTSSTSGQIVQTANSFSTSALSFSYETLFNKNSLPGSSGVFWTLNGTQNGNNSNTGFAGFAARLRLQLNGTIAFGISTGSAITEVVSTATVADGQTHHITVTYNGSALTLYVDGVSQGTAAATITGITAFVVIGDRSTAVGDAQCEYLLSRCAFYKGVVLTASQAANHYNLFVNFPVSAYDAQVSTDGATNYWKLIETSGTTAADSIGTDTGTYENSPSLNQSLPSIQFFGSPAIAHGRPSYLGLQYQSLAHRIPLSNGNIAVKASSGQSGGGGNKITGGGGSGVLRGSTF